MGVTNTRRESAARGTFWSGAGEGGGRLKLGFGWVRGGVGAFGGEAPFSGGNVKGEMNAGCWENEERGILRGYYRYYESVL